MPQKIVIIDTDAGMDDAVAIFMAVAADRDPSVDFHIAGITCVHGNTTVDHVCKNVKRTLAAVNALDIPVFRGCESAMAVPYVQSHPPFNGYDGFGDLSLPDITSKIEEENGILAIIRIAKQFPGQVSILALGPLTNLALAVRLDPSLQDLLKEIVLMGGNTEAIGNTTVCGEFNFRADPEAAHVTLATFQCPVTIVPWEVNKRQNHIDFRLNELSKIGSPAMELLNTIEPNWTLIMGRWRPADALASAVLIEPKVIQDSKIVHTTVELAGYHTRGQMVIDHENQLGQRKNAQVAYSCDIPLYLNMIRWGLGGPFYKQNKDSS